MPARSVKIGWANGRLAEMADDNQDVRCKILG